MHDIVQKTEFRSASKEDVIGKSVTRLEDKPLVLGEGCFAADVSFPHQLYMRVARSSVASGHIRSIDTSEAISAPGVLAVWTHDDVSEIPLIPFRATKVQGLEPYCQPILAKKRVRYVGEPVAVVIATDPYLAEDAVDRLIVEIDELPALLSAVSDPVLFDAERLSEPAVIRKAYGDIDAAFANSSSEIELELAVGRHSGVPLECRGAVARYDAARDVLELYGAAKKQHWNRNELCKMLGRTTSSMHLYEGHIGGGFGVRGELYPEDVLVCIAALRLRRPIKWIEDRRENLMATNHSRQQTFRLRAAIDPVGRILGIDCTIFHDQGAYVRTHGARVADLAAGMLLGPYRVPSYRVAAHYRLTNKTPAATYRAPGRYETTFARERLMDAVAEKIGIDPIEVRRRNLISKEEMPYTRNLDAVGVDVVLDSGDYAGLLEKTLVRVNWNGLKQEVALRRAKGECVGLGLALFVEKSGLGPSDGVKLKVDSTGGIELITGAASVGQGVETALAQICAATLGVSYQSIRVIHGRTDQIDYGNGAHASRVTVMSGTATLYAARAVRAKAIEIASQLLQTPPELLEIVDGNVRRRDVEGGPVVSLATVARNLEPDSKLLGGREPGLSAEGWFYSDHMTYPYGVHIGLVRVDPGTGEVRVERYFVSNDVGRAVNPMLIEGQIVGGFAQGLGGALFEEFRYDERGEPLSTTFADYLIPTAGEMPSVEVLITEDEPSPLNPLGLKGAGEGGTNGVGAAIAAAVDDALGRPGRIKKLPITPADIQRN